MSLAKMFCKCQKQQKKSKFGKYILISIVAAHPSHFNVLTDKDLALIKLGSHWQYAENCQIYSAVAKTTEPFEAFKHANIWKDLGKDEEKVWMKPHYNWLEAYLEPLTVYKEKYSIQIID